jgi:hypothetical protein
MSEDAENVTAGPDTGVLPPEPPAEQPIAKRLRASSALAVSGIREGFTFVILIQARLRPM